VLHAAALDSRAKLGTARTGARVISEL